MKAVVVFVCALCVLASAYPRASRDVESKEDEIHDTELYIVPLERSQPRRPPVFGFGLPQDLVPPPFEQHPFFRTNPWEDVAPAGEEHAGDFMMQMQEMLREMQKQLTDLLHRSHTLPDGNTSVVDTRISDEDLPQNKSTSTTKVIDGHVVTVNETTYSSGDDNIGAVFRIKVVEVKPSETPEDETPSEAEETPSEGEETPSQEPSSSEESHVEEREPTTSKSELDEDKHDETNEIPNQKVREEWSEWDSETDPSLNEIDQPEVFSVDKVPLVKKENYYDLSGDTKVNDYLSDQAESQGMVMIDPDAEVIDSNQYYHYSRVPQTLQRLTL